MEDSLEVVFVVHSSHRQFLFECGKYSICKEYHLRTVDNVLINTVGQICWNVLPFF